MSFPSKAMVFLWLHYTQDSAPVSVGSRKALDFAGLPAELEDPGGTRHFAGLSRFA